MKELQRKQRIKQIMYSWPSLAILLILAFFMVRGVVNILLLERESASKLVYLENQTNILDDREVELKAEIARLQTEEGVVEEIKEKFSVTREGEFVAIIVEERSVATETEETTSEKFKGWWKRAKNLWRD